MHCRPALAGTASSAISLVVLILVVCLSSACSAAACSAAFLAADFLVMVITSFGIRSGENLLC